MSERTLHERVETTAGGYKFIRLKSGRRLTFWDAIAASERAFTSLATATSRAVKLAGDDDWDLERLEWRLDQLEEYVGAVRAHLEKIHGVRSKQERIALLRNTTGRAPAEAEAFLRKADQLEAEVGS